MVLPWIFYKTTKFRSESMTLKGHRMKIDIADTLPKQMVGLMYRDSLPKDSGMLFIFNKDDNYPIWMLNMKFDLDIIWLDRDGRIVDIKKSARPAKSMLSAELYKPSKSARYVLEVNSGISNKYKISVGEKVKLPIR